jgi:hypothetical protein
MILAEQIQSVENMTRCYHVDRVMNRLKAGQVINLIHDKSTITHTTDRARCYVNMFPDGVTYHGWNYLLNTDRPAPHQDLLGMIEVLAEQIRRADHPHRISRFQAVFGFRTIQDAERFISLYPVTLPNGVQRKQGDIWEVEGEVEFESDMQRLSLGNCWLDALININAYWQGVHSSSPLREVLLKPPVRVIRRVNQLTIE